MEHTHPTPILLHNGVLMPRLGLGTFKAKGNEVKKAVQWALQCGYRLIDTASIYKNEVEIGEAVQDANIKRDELFICSKVSPFEHGEFLVMFDMRVTLAYANVRIWSVIWEAKVQLVSKA
jgi:diketogulonate reductase-like aldo/keto reductase